MPESITSPHNPRVKAALRLRQRQGRDDQGRILIDGARELRRAIEAGVEMIEVYHAPQLAIGNEALATLERIATRAIATLEVPPELFAKLTYGDRHDGLIGVARMPTRSLSEIELPAAPLVCVLEGVEKPGNFGAVLRSADATGVAAVIAADPRTDLYNPNAIRASLGTIFTRPVASATSAETLAWLRNAGLQIVAARVEAATLYTEIDWRRPTAIVLGSEADGLTAAWNTPDIVPVRLPMLGVADSLNVSISAAVLFYEALRQRNAEPGTRESAGH